MSDVQYLLSQYQGGDEFIRAKAVNDLVELAVDAERFVGNAKVPATLSREARFELGVSAIDIGGVGAFHVAVMVFASLATTPGSIRGDDYESLQLANAATLLDPCDVLEGLVAQIQHGDDAQLAAAMLLALCVIDSPLSRAVWSKGAAIARLDQMIERRSYNECWARNWRKLRQRLRE